VQLLSRPRTITNAWFIVLAECLLSSGEQNG
jgi:hypothetical protein